MYKKFVRTPLYPRGLRTFFYCQRITFTPQQLPVRRLILRLICWFFNDLRLDWSTYELRFSYILHVLHVDVSYYFVRIFIILQNIQFFFARISIYVIKSVFIWTLTFRVITQFGQQSGQHFARPFLLYSHHILWKGNNP